MIFDSQITMRGTFPAFIWSQDDIKNEPMFFNCDLNFARQHGGPITRAFIRSLPPDWIDCNPVLDSRVHMLMPGWYPCIPGWHHDDVPRGGPFNQPVYDGTCDSEHLMGLVNGDIAATKFALGRVAVTAPTDKKMVYREWSDEIDRQLLTPDPKFVVVSAPNGELIQFDWQTFHSGVRASQGGWRWFVRLSRNTERQARITNELRHQVQVYLEFPQEGW